MKQGAGAVPNRMTTVPNRLERSFEAGLADPDWMRDDSDLDNVQNHPRYEALSERMEANG